MPPKDMFQNPLLAKTTCDRLVEELFSEGSAGVTPKIVSKEVVKLPFGSLARIVLDAHSF